MMHTPVLLDRSIEGLDIKPDGIYVDGTLGYGGHSSEIVKRLTTGRLIAIDRDAGALEQASKRLAGLSNNITFVHGNFGDIDSHLDDNDIDFADGMLFDFGLSSLQLDVFKRGFSYSNDEPLDMRMDMRDGLKAYEIVNNWPADRLRSIFYKYGEERYSGLIAKAILKKRAEAPILTTFELNETIFSAMPAAARREPQHPSKRCFQALRIAVNDELGAISKMLAKAPDRLKAGGRICVISFHSLEDRLCKTAFNERARGCTCPKNFPVCVCGVSPTLKIITKKPITPDEIEINDNPRARSGKLRIAERL